MTNPSKSTHFLRKVRNQVLKKKNREIKYKPQYYIFGYIDRYADTFQNVFFNNRFDKDKGTGYKYYRGPKGYPWENDTKCYFFYRPPRKEGNTILVIPHKWLLEYDPTIPIFSAVWDDSCYLDLEKLEYSRSMAYLIGERFYLFGIDHFPRRGDPKSYSIGKGYEDWCLTCLDWYSLFKNRGFFRSLLQMKNIDFSDFDASVKARGLECPVPHGGDIRLKERLNLVISGHNYGKKPQPCICVKCRKDYRAIEVGIDADVDSTTIHLFLPIK